MEYINFGITIIIILLIFYFARTPKKNQEKALQKMQEELKIGDKIITYSGLSGEITQVLEDRIIVKLNPSKMEISIEKWAVAGLDDRTLEEKKL